MLNLKTAGSLKNKIGASHRVRNLKRSKLHLLWYSLLACGTLLLSSCSSSDVSLPDPQIKIYLLDLTSSGDVSNQLRLIEDDLVTDLTSGSLGSPYANEGPSLTKFYFVGTNSRALREFSLQDRQGAYNLFQYIKEENNGTRTEKFWRLLSEKYENYMLDQIENGKFPSKQECFSDFDTILLPTWSSNRVRGVYSAFMCKMATYSLSSFEELRVYIDEQSQPGFQKASDVFGALSKIDSQIQKYTYEYPKAKVKLILATDGDHNLGANSPSNLRKNIQASSNLCALADDYRSEFELNNLKTGPNLEIDARGISALTQGMGEYPRNLESFWNCFFPSV